MSAKVWNRFRRRFAPPSALRAARLRRDGRPSATPDAQGERSDALVMSSPSLEQSVA